MEAQIAAYQDEEEEKKSAFVDTWDEEEEKDINVQAFHKDSPPPLEDLPSASRFLGNYPNQHRVNSDSINPDFSADLILDGTQEDEAGPNNLRSLNEQIYQMNSSLAQPTIIESPKLLKKLFVHPSSNESQPAERPISSPKKKEQTKSLHSSPKLLKNLFVHTSSNESQRVERPISSPTKKEQSKSWGLQTFAAIKLGGITKIMKRK